MYYCSDFYSPVGAYTMASDGKVLIALWKKGQKFYGQSVPEELLPDADLPIFALAADWLNCYFEGGRPKISDLVIAPRGSAFRQVVWNILCEIPYGEYVSYGEVAKIAAARMGRCSMSAQAVGGAIGHNPISIIIPCHRVIGSNKSLTGYAGGIGTKIKLLEHEGVSTSALLIPQKGTAL